MLSLAAVDTVSSRQEEFLITGFVVTVLSTLLLSVVGVVLVLRRKLSRRGQYAAVILVNEEYVINLLSFFLPVPFPLLEVLRILSK